MPLLYEPSRFSCVLWLVSNVSSVLYFHCWAFIGELAHAFLPIVSWKYRGRALELWPKPTDSATYLHSLFFSIYAVLWPRKVHRFWGSPVEVKFYCSVFSSQTSTSDFRGCAQCYFNWRKQINSLKNISKSYNTWLKRCMFPWFKFILKFWLGFSYQVS